MGLSISGHILTRQQYEMVQCAGRHWEQDKINHQLSVETLLWHWAREVSENIPLYSILWVKDLLVELDYFEYV